MLIVFISALHFLNDIVDRYRNNRNPESTVSATGSAIKMTSSTLNKDARQTSHAITFYGDEENQCYEITESDIVVYGSTGHNAHGSSKVKLQNLVDYKWETKNYPGHLIAVHMDGKCVAYVINVNNKMSGVEGMVRVTSSGKRSLIKGMSGEVLDIQFAHNEKQRILACAEAHMLHIYKIDILSDNLVCNLILEIDDPLANYVPRYDKISWCPYVPDDASDTDDDTNQLLVWSRGNCFQCFNVSTVICSYENGRHAADSITEGYLKLEDSAINITWVALSPDGTTLSVGSDDGFIRFYQVYFHEKEPRCLHQWNPHNGKPISSFFFLDNLTKTSADAYWKYALTGANRNTEFKIWDCGTWDCLQTISLRSKETENLTFIADIDRTASYLIVSSIESSAAYVIQLVNEIQSNDEKSDENDSDKSSTSANSSRDDSIKKISVFMKSISEFPLSSPFLSYSIVDASVRKYKSHETEGILADDVDDYDDESSAVYCVVVRMFVVQPKSLQECHIIYQPTVTETAEVRSSISSSGNYGDVLLESSSQWNPDEKSISEKSIEKLSDFEQFSAKTSNIKDSKSPKPLLSAVPQKSSHPVNLMTPDSFNTTSSISESKPTETVSSEVLSTILMLASVTNSSSVNQKSIENMNLLNLVNNKVIEDREQQKHQRNNHPQNEFTGSNDTLSHNNPDRSGGSSPSREVQQILSTNDFIIPQNKTFFLEKPTANDGVQRTDGENGSQNLFGDRGLDENSTKASGNLKDWSKFPNLPNIPAKHSIQPKATKMIISDSGSELKDVNAKLDQLLNHLQNQSMHISELKSELDHVKKQNAELVENTRRNHLNAEYRLSKIMEDNFGRFEKEHKQRFDNLVAMRSAQNRELKETIMHLLNQYLYNQFPEKMTSIITSEMQKQITSAVMAKMDVLNQHLQSEIAQKLTATDKVLKESIAQVCRSKNIVEAFGNSILVGVQNGLQNAYMQSMSSILIPAYEKSSSEMFKQLHDSFALGMKEVVEHFDRYFSQVQPVQEGIDQMSRKVEIFHKYVESALVEQRTNGNSNHMEMKKDFKTLELAIVKIITDVVQKEVRKNFETQAATLEDSVLSAVRSQAQTPAPSMYDVQDQIKYLLYQGHINKAFHQALIANDLTLVEYALEKADYKSVFNPCVLEQTVLLSLIQQISADMDNHNEIKQRYLADAIINLSYTDPITKEHAPRVMRELYKNCQNFLTSYPKNQLCSNIRMIMMAVQGMGFKVV